MGNSKSKKSNNLNATSLKACINLVNGHCKNM